VDHNNAIVLAMFGTSVESALPGLLHIRDQMVEAYPGTRVDIALTSNIIRRIWRKRAQDREYRRNHPDVPDAILHAQGPLAVIANLQDAGFDSIVVQPVHIAPAEEFVDLTAYVDGLNSIQTMKSACNPFYKLVIGRPALGTFGDRYPYADDIKSAAQALAADARLAEQRGAALLYMGHGSNSFPSGGVYLQFAAEMRVRYPGVVIVIATVEGFPAIDDAVSRLQKSGIKKVLLKPFMVVAGSHVLKDMTGPDSWAVFLEKQGFEVEPVMSGLGEQDSFAGIFVNHAGDAAADAGIVLR